MLISTKVGTVCYSLVAELSSRRLLMKTINLGRGVCILHFLSRNADRAVSALRYSGYCHWNDYTVYAEPYRMGEYHSPGYDKYIPPPHILSLRNVPLTFPSRNTPDVILLTGTDGTL